jgi:hypothetical protein
MRFKPETKVDLAQWVGDLEEEVGNLMDSLERRSGASPQDIVWAVVSEARQHFSQDLLGSDEVASILLQELDELVYGVVTEQRVSRKPTDTAISNICDLVSYFNERVARTLFQPVLAGARLMVGRDAVH